MRKNAYNPHEEASRAAIEQAVVIVKHLPLMQHYVKVPSRNPGDVLEVTAGDLEHLTLSVRPESLTVPFTMSLNYRREFTSDLSDAASARQCGAIVSEMNKACGEAGFRAGVEKYDNRRIVTLSGEYKVNNLPSVELIVRSFHKFITLAENLKA